MSARRVREGLRGKKEADFLWSTMLATRTHRPFLASRSTKELSAQRHRRYVELVRRTKGPAVARKVQRRSPD